MSVDKRKALGRGLSSLIPGAGGAGSSAAAPSAAPAPERRRDYFVCAIEDVHPSGVNPRKTFDEAAMAELVGSIRDNGLLQPLVVRARKGSGFTLIAGHRRWQAAQKAGLKEVPVVVKEASDGEAFILALVENLHRSDLNPIEEAESYRVLVEEQGLSQEQVAERFGKDRSTIVNQMRLLKLPQPVRQLLVDRRLQMGHARALLGLEGAPAIERAADEVVKGEMSVRQTEALVKRSRDAESPAKKPAAKPDGKSANVRDLEARLHRALDGLPVAIKERAHNAGSVEITYANLDELDRVIEKLLRP